MNINELALNDTWLFEFRQRDGIHKVSSVSGGLSYSRFYQLVANAYSAASVSIDDDILCICFYKMKGMTAVDTQIYKDISTAFSSAILVYANRGVIEITDAIEIVEFKLKYS